MSASEVISAGIAIMASTVYINNHYSDNKVQTTVDARPVAAIHEVLKEAPATKIEKQIDPTYAAFINECQRYGFEKQRCLNIWHNNLPVYEETKKAVREQANDNALVFTHSGTHQAIIEKPLEKLDVENPEYIKRREEVLQRPDAVVMHATIR